MVVYHLVTGLLLAITGSGTLSYIQGLPRRRVFGLWTPTAPHSPQSAGLGYRVFQGAGLSDYETSVVLGVWATGLVLCIPR